MKRYLLLLIGGLLAIGLLAGCDTQFQMNPHGPEYVDTLTPTVVPHVVGTPAQEPHLSLAGFGSTLPDLVAQYGAPTGYSSPPLYAFQDQGQAKWPKGSLIIVTMKSNRAVEFAYDPGTDHPMTYQEAQDFAVKLLPDDAQGPTTIQPEVDRSGECLAKTYTSKILATLFPADDFISASGKDATPGTITVNFFPDFQESVSTSDGTMQQIPSMTGGTMLQNHDQVNSILVNLGSVPDC